MSETKCYQMVAQMVQIMSCASSYAYPTTYQLIPVKWCHLAFVCMVYRADSRLAPNQWETSLQSNAVSHWLGANLESALLCIIWYSDFRIVFLSEPVIPECFNGAINGCFDTKVLSFENTISHHNDKLVLWLSYLYNGKAHNWKTNLILKCGPVICPLNGYLSGIKCYHWI